MGLVAHWEASASSTVFSSHDEILQEGPPNMLPFPIAVINLIDYLDTFHLGGAGSL